MDDSRNIRNAFFRRFISLALIFGIAFFAFAAGRAGADGPRIGVNLIADGDAEAENSDVWQPADILKTIQYGEFGGGPAPDSPGPANRGGHYFYAKVTTENPRAVVSQNLDVSAATTTIDGGRIGYRMGGFFGGVNTSFSSARLSAEFLDKTGKKLGGDTTDEVLESDRADDLVLIERTRSGALPAGTRTVRIRLEFYIRPGHEKEAIETLAYADNLAFSLAAR
jgi:hypothetical protein